MALPLGYVRWFKDSSSESVLYAWREYLSYRDTEHTNRPWVTLWHENEVEVKQYILRAQIELATRSK